MTGSASPIELVPYERALGSGFEDMPRRIPDLAKIHAAIGYAPTRDLREMLDAIIAWRRVEHPRHARSAW
jgi:UDP-glucose 4-epimerase